jgi:hypothetical protein
MQTAIGWVLAGIMCVVMGAITGWIGLQIYGAWGDWAFYTFMGLCILIVTLDNWYRRRR